MNVIGVVGWKNCGKTTLCERIIGELVSRGLRVNSIKHAHHSVDLDQPGTDSYRHRQAGAGEVILATDRRYALLHELRDQAEPNLSELLTRIGDCDWVVVEGYKQQSHPKIEVHRQVCTQAPRYGDDPSIRAVATDYPSDFAGPRFDLNDVAGICDWLLSGALND